MVFYIYIYTHIYIRVYSGQAAFEIYRNFAFTLEFTAKHKAKLPIEQGLVAEQKNISLQALVNLERMLTFPLPMKLE